MMSPSTSLANWIWEQPEYRVAQESNPYKSDGIVFMEFTGLLDSEGKEIYEGDVIQIELDWGTPKKCKAEIVFEYGRFCGKSLRQHDIVGKGKRWITINLAEDHNGCQVIGNIYENQGTEDTG